MNKTKVIDLIIKLIVVLTIGLAFYFNSVLPDKVITHWGINGEPDDWGSKNFHVLFTPLLLIGLWFMFIFLPKLDPKKRNYADFSTAYKVMQVLIIGFLFAIFLLTSLINMGYNIPVNIVIPWLVGIMFLVIGIFMKDIKPNWFVGIRTPWTLSNDEVWKKTHIYGGKSFIFGGLMFLATPFFPPGLFFYALILAILAILSSLVYSYFVYKNIKSGPNQDQSL